MEALNNYNFRGYNFTLWFFRILLIIVATIVVLVFVLQINETVAVQEGEIVAANPQVDFKAPFEAQILKVNVREGQPVKKGDTLLVMLNTEYRAQLSKTKTEIEYLQKKIESIGVLQNAVQKKKAALDQTSSITAKAYQLDINRLVGDMRAMDEQHRLQRERLSAVQEKYAGDSILYSKDMLSKYEYNTTKDASLALKESLSTMQNQRSRQRSEKNIAYNEFTREQNSLQLTRVQLEENTQALIQAHNDYESQLIQAKENLHKLQTELDKQYIVATANGIVNHLYNTRQTSNVISKGDLLISVAPKSVSYYAKVFLPEKELPYVRAGLNAKLKLSAYQRFQRGPINGKVSYVAELKENDKFYALVQLSNPKNYQLKSGYTVNGEIVVQRVPLIKYFVKKLFKKFDEV